MINITHPKLFIKITSISNVDDLLSALLGTALTLSSSEGKKRQQDMSYDDYSKHALHIK